MHRRSRLPRPCENPFAGMAFDDCLTTDFSAEMSACTQACVARWGLALPELDDRIVSQARSPAPYTALTGSACRQTSHPRHQTLVMPSHACLVHLSSNRRFLNALRACL